MLDDFLFEVDLVSLGGEGIFLDPVQFEEYLKLIVD